MIALGVHRADISRQGLFESLSDPVLPSCSHPETICMVFQVTQKESYNYSVSGSFRFKHSPYYPRNSGSSMWTRLLDANLQSCQKRWIEIDNSEY